MILAVQCFFYELGCSCVCPQMLRIITSSQQIFPLSVQCFSLSLWISFCLKSILLYILACFLAPFAWSFFPSFYPELMSIFGVKVYFLDIAKGMVLFCLFVCFPSLFICVFLLELRSLMLSVINEQCLLISCYFVVVWVLGSPCPTFLICWSEIICSLCFFCVVNLFGLKGFFHSAFCRAEFVDRCCLHLVLFWNVFLSCN